MIVISSHNSIGSVLEFSFPHLTDAKGSIEYWKPFVRIECNDTVSDYEVVAAYGANLFVNSIHGILMFISLACYKAIPGNLYRLACETKLLYPLTFTGILLGVLIQFFLFRQYMASVGIIIAVGTTGILTTLLCYVPTFLSVNSLYIIFCTFCMMKLVVSFAAGILTAYLVVKKYKDSMKYFVGAIGGVLFAAVVNPLGPAYLFYFAFFLIAIGCAVGGAFLAKKNFKNVYICTASLLSAYMIARGISAFAGHYPNSIEFYKELKKGESRVI